MELTQEYLKSILHYNSESGTFTWIKSNRYGWVGKIAGCSRTVRGENYRVIRINHVLYPAHRLAWFYTSGVWPDKEIDHIDRNGSNNSIINLREATRLENNCNKALNTRNTSGVKGVRWHGVARKWEARVNFNKVEYYLGLFETIEQADSVVRAKRLELHGEFVRHA